MRTLKLLSGFLVIAMPLASCGHVTQPPRPVPPAPFAYLRLTACRSYAGNIVECQLEYATNYGRQRLGPVQQRALAIGREDDRYQVSSCWPAPRIQKELPNFVCRISGSRSGADANSVLVKGGTAVLLARILGDRKQIQYRWTPDKWSRLRD